MVFGSDSTIFVSMGATCANTIAVGAAAEFGRRVLVDATAHQSVHFACDLYRLEVSRVTSLSPSSGGVDVECILARLQEAAALGRPFHCVVVGSSTYSGLRLDVSDFMHSIHRISPDTNLVLDDAWSAVHSFGDQTANSSPTTVARRLRDRGEFDANVWVTHSAHKTMYAMRQAAYVHTFGRSAVAATQSSAHRHHTSSPSWPIMASLDLARAHAQSEGNDRIRDAMNRKAVIERWLHAKGFDGVGDAATFSRWFHQDELRLVIPIEESPAAIREVLLAQDGVYLPQQFGPNLIANITIGVDDEAVDALLSGLSRVQITPRTDAQRKAEQRGDAPYPTVRDNEYLIAYPPGVPLVFPESRLEGGSRTGFAPNSAGLATLHRVSTILHE
ncbi:aminotransferase class I/II-fold pyridoxal phosphate-dependent enzyme [Rhodococcus sp. HNM0563]|nr:aminotransferase class I/II-fold pyridoxal phosphate-dependent enzyme [Rhodococcus sp. HNM0563]